MDTTLADKLNLYKVCFSFTKTGVELEACPEDNSLFDAEGNVADQALSSFLDELSSYSGYVDYDPRDARAGLVVFVEAEGKRAWFDLSGECSWTDV